MPLPSPTIGDWPITQLVKFIKDILENQPPRNLPDVIVGNAQVDKLALKSAITFPGNPDFHLIGATGEPAFQNGWVNWGAPYFGAGYWHDPLGFVHLQGVIKSGTVGSPAFTLPPGLKPAATAGPYMAISNNAVGRVDIGSDGTVTPVSPASNVYVSLAGIYFKAA